MLAIIGAVVVIAAIIGGYLLEHGNLAVLFQPAELVIIGGAAAGTVLIANPVYLVKKLAGAAIGVLKGSPYTKSAYLEALRMLNELFSRGRKEGLAKLEADIEDPSKSALLANYKGFMKNHHAVSFLCDTLRVAVAGGAAPHDMDQLMEMDLEVHHHESRKPVAALTSVADSLPGLGIVAAVLGVVITMGALGGPPEEIGHKVAAALVGTFLGILMCYGFLAPLAQNIEKIAEAEGQYLNCLRVGLFAFLKGASPLIAVEFARRVIPAQCRPTFHELEAACKKKAA